MIEKLEAKLRENCTQYMHLLEALLYVCVGIILGFAAFAAVFEAAQGLWGRLISGSVASSGFEILDQLLLVLILVEILHTVRISLRSHEVVVEPFLIVGLMASIRRVLVITMQAAKLTEQDHNTPSGEIMFRNSMIELGLSGVLIILFVFSMWMLRRSHGRNLLQARESPSDVS